MFSNTRFSINLAFVILLWAPILNAMESETCPPDITRQQWQKSAALFKVYNAIKLCTPVESNSLDREFDAKGCDTNCRVRELEKLAQKCNLETDGARLRDLIAATPHEVLYSANHSVLRTAIKHNNMLFIHAVNATFPYHSIIIDLSDNPTDYSKLFPWGAVDKQKLAVAKDYVLNMSKEMANVISESDKVIFHEMGSVTSREIEKKCTSWFRNPLYQYGGCEHFLASMANWRLNGSRTIVCDSADGY